MKKYLIITGASRGIGKSTAALFLKNGWRVINISRTACDLPDIINISCDLSQELGSQLSTLRSHIEKSSIISLVHNACYYHKDSIYDLNSEIFRDILAANVIAPMVLNPFVLPYMAKGSSIIYLGSTLSEKAVPEAASYTISKHASIGMMRSTCQDLQAGIHTCCICPGFTETEMMQTHLKNNIELQETIKNRVKAHRLIEPQEIADLIFYCAQNPVINGSVIHANLGQIEQ